MANNTNSPTTPAISVIVPVYNVKEYLSKCIESILSQTYSAFELILVDDGSTDGSGEICDDYASKDPRVRVIHKINGGVSSARNLGLGIVDYEYITFVDSDDYLGKAYLQKLSEAMSHSDADMVVGGEIKVENGREQTFSFRNDILSQKRFSQLFSEYDLQKRCSPWGKLLKTQIIKEVKLEFDEKIHLGEDIIFMFQYISSCKSICLTSSSEYYYIQREGSLTKRLNNFASESHGYYEYTRAKDQLIDKFNFDDLSHRKLNQWSIIFLDRIKRSILKISSQYMQIKAFDEFDWRQLKEYKVFNSKKEYFLDSLLWHKFFLLFQIIHKLYNNLK